MELKKLGLPFDGRKSVLAERLARAQLVRSITAQVDPVQLSAPRARPFVVRVTITDAAGSFVSCQLLGAESSTTALAITTPTATTTAATAGDLMVCPFVPASSWPDMEELMADVFHLVDLVSSGGVHDATTAYDASGLMAAAFCAGSDALAQALATDSSSSDATREVAARLEELFEAFVTYVEASSSPSSSSMWRDDGEGLQAAILAQNVVVRSVRAAGDFFMVCAWDDDYRANDGDVIASRRCRVVQPGWSIVG